MIKSVCVLATAALLLSACNKAPPPERVADNDDGETITMAAPHVFTDAEKKTIQASFPAPYDTADLAAGEQQFVKCRACHTITANKMNLTGPHLYGLFGRKSGTEPGYTYSEAMKNHNVVWDFATLDTYIAAPQTVVKGTKMSYQGIKDETDRHNLLAYLKLETTPVDDAQASSGSASAAP
ncbi:MAG: cytochrome c family protein [Asticcacaulis sp.]